MNESFFFPILPIIIFIGVIAALSITRAVVKFLPKNLKMNNGDKFIGYTKVETKEGVTYYIPTLPNGTVATKRGSMVDWHSKVTLEVMMVNTPREAQAIAWDKHWEMENPSGVRVK